MSLDPFLSAPVHIQFHAASAMLAILIGPLALYRRKRDRAHKVVGYTWVLAMLGVAISAFFIHSFPVIGPFSPIHGLAVFTMWSLWRGIRFARVGDITGHKAVMRNLYWSGLIIAGLANFLPGRTSNRAAFGGQDDLGYVVIGVGAGVLVGLAVWGRRRASGSARSDQTTDAIAAQ